MFQRKSFSLLPPEVVEAYQANDQERQVIEEDTGRALHGTPAQVAAGLEELHDQTGADEVMLVAQGYSRRAQARTLELIADHYGMPTANGDIPTIGANARSNGLGNERGPAIRPLSIRKLLCRLLALSAGCTCCPQQ